ncbi:unnamed protein product [Cylindrotheca closterium]|uniref:Uncharacterized protein n=1 Tax=Cylindrotheca closterium TaxID=2856 RepID=A0AAD2FFA7_9STRA|nr:unnamed protein product [Cylindrotheca closterium]
MRSHASAAAAAASSATVNTRTSQLYSEITPNEIKLQLEKYLKKREVLNADEIEKAERGKVLGGTKGNKVLDFISGAPSKEFVIEDVPNVFDYDQLTKYGYSSLVTPIMELGGRRAVYDLMGMKAPPTKGPPPKVVTPKIVIDRTGADDEGRYSGLKMGLGMDDDAMAEALAKASQKSKEGKGLRKRIMEETYEQPFADKRNVGPRQTPDWTPEAIDELTKKQGQAQSWARRSRANRMVTDDGELLVLNFPMTAYCLFTSFLSAFAYGKSTPTFLNMVGMSDTTFSDLLQAPGLILILTCIGSSFYSASVLAPPLNRSSLVWAFKGLCGGPFAILELRELDPLISRAEYDKENNNTGL